MITDMVERTMIRLAVGRARFYGVNINEIVEAVKGGNNPRSISGFVHVEHLFTEARGTRMDEYTKAIFLEMFDKGA